MPRHRILWVISLLVITIFLFPNLSFSATERRLALLIGNSHYTHGGSLDNPVNDVRAIKKALEGLGFTVMKYEDCSQKTMKRAMDKFGRKLRGRDVGLFFYAGHGVQVRGNNYLLPVDAKLDTEHDAEYDCVRADRVLAKMEGAGSRTNIVILDACRDNPFERSWRRGTEGAGLAFMNAPSGSLIAYSTAPGKTALDGRGKNSPYTSALLQHINTPNITVIEMFQWVRSTVMAKSGSKQIPWESTSLRGNFYFSTKGKDDRLGEERARLERERSELEKLKAEIDWKRYKESGKLFVDTEPSNTTIRILNIGPKFYQGMELKPGSYHVEVSKQGYKTDKKWVNLDTGENKRLEIQLEQLQASIQPSSTYTRPSSTTSDEIQRDGEKVEIVSRPKESSHTTPPPGNKVGQISSLNRSWGFFVIEISNRDAVRIGDEVYAIGREGREYAFRINRISGRTASATIKILPTENLEGSNVYKKDR